jgi:hypothetical protein
MQLIPGPGMQFHGDVVGAAFQTETPERKGQPETAPIDAVGEGRRPTIEEAARKRPGPLMRLGLGAKFTLTVLVILAGTMAANTLYFLDTSTRFPRKAARRTRPRARAPDFAGQPGGDTGIRSSAVERLHP